MEEKYYYNTSVQWDEGRVGTLSSPTLDSFKVATPPEFPKGVPIHGRPSIFMLPL